jgi:hypothetical protein
MKEPTNHFVNRNVVIKLTILCLSFFPVSIVAQRGRNDSAIVNTKFGQLKFIQNCNKKSLILYQNAGPIVNMEVEQEAFKRDIREDKMKLKIEVNNRGQVASCYIIKKAKLKSLNIFITQLFNEVILKMMDSDESLTCESEARVYKVPLKYVRQKTLKKLNKVY